MKSSKEELFAELDEVYFTRLMANVDLMAELYNLRSSTSEHTTLNNWAIELRDDAERILERVCNAHGWSIAEFDRALNATTVAYLKNSCTS